MAGADAGDCWPGEVDGESAEPAPVEDRGEAAAPDGEEERLALDNCLDDRSPENTENCEELSPPEQEGEMEANEEDSPAQGTIVMIPLEGSNAELRTRVIKEVRKPGRSECLIIITNSYLKHFHFSILFELLSGFSRVHLCYERGCILLELIKLNFFCADYEAIFRLLEEVKGPVSVQRYFIHHAIKEAAR